MIKWNVLLWMQELGKMYSCKKEHLPIFIQVILNFSKIVDPKILKFECQECGPFPRVLIADGTGVYC